MADNELLIKINADAKNATKAFDDMRSKTEDLESQLNKAAVVSGVAFAAFTAEIYLSVRAFEEAQQASIQLTNALQNQGIYTEELTNEYKAYAEAVQEATGIDDDAIVKAQAIAQTYLGQTKITKELTQSIADLSATMGGDLNGAAEKIARTIGTGTNAFARQGLVIAEGATEAERYAKVLEFVQLKAGGLAEEFNKADGYTKALTTAIGNFQEQIGARFAPIIASARQIAIEFFNAFTKYPILADVAVALITAGAAVSGIVAAISVAVPAFLALSAAAAAFGVALAPLLGLAAGIGVIIGAITLLALNWDKALASMTAAALAAVTLISELFSGLGKVLAGAFSLDATKIKQGLAEITGAFKKASTVATQTYQEITDSQKKELQVQDQDKAAAAAKVQAKEREHQAILRQIRQSEIALLRLQNENASKEIIDLKSKELETLKALSTQQNETEISLLKQRLDKIRELQAEAQTEDIARRQAYGQLVMESDAELAQQGLDFDAELTEKKEAELLSQVKTQQDIDRQVQEESISGQIATNNQLLLDKKKYGETYAIINKAINSEEVKGVKSASGELVALQQSKNETLKSIGKAAAIAQITVDTATSAMSIYRGFATIPIVGPALGIAGAAAAVAFGAERIGQVTAAQTGGLIEGGIPGKDSVPALLEPGELVVPRKNFNDVVGPLQNGGADNSEMVSLLQSIDQKFSNPQVTNINGDVQSDDAYIDSLVRKISDAIEFRNGKLAGINT